jgi:hypothetical protein
MRSLAQMQIGPTKTFPRLRALRCHITIYGWKLNPGQARTLPVPCQAAQTVPAIGSVMRTGDQNKAGLARH